MKRKMVDYKKLIALGLVTSGLAGVSLFDKYSEPTFISGQVTTTGEYSFSIATISGETTRFTSGRHLVDRGDHVTIKLNPIKKIMGEPYSVSLENMFEINDDRE